MLSHSWICFVGKSNSIRHNINVLAFLFLIGYLSVNKQASKSEIIYL